MACPTPGNVSKCLATPTYAIGGVVYVTIELCDNNGKLLAVYELCDGVLTGTPSYYDLSGNSYTPVGTPHSCENGDFEQFIFCDTDTDPPTPFISRVRWDESGDLIPEQTGTFALDGQTPYTPVGTVTVCGGDVVDTEIVGPLCEKDATGNTVGYVWHKIFYRGQTQLAVVLAGYKLAAAGTWVDPYLLGAGNTLAACDSKSPQLVVLCDEYPVPCEVGNLITDAAWANTGFVDAMGGGVYRFSNADRAINGVMNQTVTVTPGSTYDFSATLGSQGIGAGIADAKVEILDSNNVVLFTQTTNNATVNFPAIVAPDAVLKVRITDQTTSTINKDLLVSAVSLTCVTPVDKTITNQFIRHYCMDCANGTTRDTALDGVTAYTVQGTVKLCQNDGTIEILCKCDDTDGDGVGETAYKEIVSIAADGTVTALTTYNRSMTVAYTPVSPVDCSVPGDNLVSVVPRYKVMQGVGTWVLGADSAPPTLSVSFTVVAVGNVATPPTVTDTGGVYPLYSQQSVNWSVVHLRDVSGLKVPLVLTTGAGDIVTVAWTEEVA